MSTNRPHDDELVARITRALHSRDADQPDPAVVAARIQAELAHVPDVPVRVLARRGGRLVAAGVLTSTLAVAGAGAAAAANPYSDVARVVEGVAQSVGLEWSAMPDGYTREQYEAFWGAGYTIDDVEALADLWHLDATATKAQAGQLLLDGQTPPVGPGATAPDGTGSDQKQAAYDAFWEAGYTVEDLETLAELWGTDPMETKARAGQLVLDGETLPLG
ncbi:hypothetical protein [Cellulomonas xylanilytica]|uniref:Uncharacterized protein n=1 Tax=Cellulomonas xylanilytica TaxID=233583 RepID=A0A510V542_9CELL|nr:hypothetical protein [Cellulomonas xylanilytica]GEK21989.1 hypothetical protein CXY01_25090 [Cellulomonas xylanilytica]